MRTSIDVAFQATFGMKKRCMMETKQYSDERSVSNEENDDYHNTVFDDIQYYSICGNIYPSEHFR